MAQVTRFMEQAIDKAMHPVVLPFRWMGASPTKFSRYGNTLGTLVNGRYQRYAQECRDQARDHVDPSGVRSQGSVLIKNVLTEVEAHQLSERVREVVESQTDLQDDRMSQLMKSVARPISTLGSGVIEIFNNEELDRRIRGFFGSHYRIQWLDCYRSLPFHEVRSSWLWHSDNVPCETLKVMLHLTDAGPNRGATQFMTIEDTQEYFQRGYRGDTSQRVEDLQSFAEEKGLPYRPFSHDSKAGDVMLFLNNALHKAVPPRDDYRDVLTYLLLPNPIPWHEQLEKDGIDVIQSNPGGYPRMPWQTNAA